MKKETKILFVAQNPGGFNALLNVIRSVKKSKNNLAVWLADESRDIARKNKINYFDCSIVTAKKLDELLIKFAPDLIVTGTSHGLSLEKKIIAWAKDNNVKTIAVVDFWSNYQTRFSNPGAEDLKYLPDKICVIDELMRRQMIGVGIAANKLEITGNPFFDNFKKIRSSQGDYILFASQPYSEICPAKKNFNEVNILKELLNSLADLNIKLPVLIKFHPREKNRLKFNDLIKNSKLKVSIVDRDIEKLISRAELVIGIDSMVLFQAALSGRRVVSIQPGNNSRRDNLISNRIGLSAPVYKNSDLRAKIKAILNSRASAGALTEARRQYSGNHATKKVIKIIETTLNKKNIVCVIQARTGSTRLPNKIFLNLRGKPVLARVIERLMSAKLITKIVVAAPAGRDNDIIENYVKREFPTVGIYRGAENDVLDRYYQTAKKFKADVVIRITSDCPLVDPAVVDKVIKVFLTKRVDYAANIIGRRTYPRGLDTEVFSFAVLAKMWLKTNQPADREHVTFFIRRNLSRFRTAPVRDKKDNSRLRLTLDEQADYRLLKLIYQKLFSRGEIFGLKEILALLAKEPALIKINSQVEQKYGQY